MLPLGSFTPSSFLAPASPLTLFGVYKYFEYIKFINNSPQQLSINLGGNVVTLGEFRVKDIAIPTWFQGTIVVTPTTVITSFGHGQSNLLVVEGYYKGEITIPEDTALPQQAVTTTATGKPIFSATFGSGGTVSTDQWVNGFMPANSGVTAEFHSIRVWSDDATEPTINTWLIPGADTNLTNAIPAVSHQGSTNPPVSAMHFTAVDSSAINHSGTVQQLVEVLDVPSKLTQDVLAFPDNLKVYPGCNLLLDLSSGTFPHIVRMTLKWTEDIIVPPVFITGGVNVATQIDSELLTVGTNLIKSVVPGPLTPVQLFNDGTGFYSIDQSGTLHRVFTFNSAGNPLQQGQAGDVMEFLGQLLTDQLLTAALGIKTTGSTSPAIDTSASTGAIALKLFAGSISRVSVFTGSASTAGQLVAHGLGVKPDWVGFTENDTVGDSNNFAWDTAASDATNVKVWGNNATARSFTALAIKL